MNTITLPVSIIEEIEKKLKAALKEVRALKKAKKRENPKPVHFWTKTQWEKAEREADEDIKTGRVYRLDKVEDLDKQQEYQQSTKSLLEVAKKVHKLLENEKLPANLSIKH